MHTKFFGITGFVASGKTEISRMFRREGIPVIDIDNVINDMFNPGTIVHRKILDTLGGEILNLNGTINTIKLSLTLCREKWVAETINDIIDDEVEDFLYKLGNALYSTNIFIGGIESNNIMNSKIKNNIDYKIFINCPDEMRLRNLLNRSNIPKKDAESIIKNKSIINFDNFDYILNNDKDLDYLNDECKKVLQIIQDCLL